MVGFSSYFFAMNKTTIFLASKPCHNLLPGQMYDYSGPCASKVLEGARAFCSSRGVGSPPQPSQQHKPKS